MKAYHILVDNTQIKTTKQKCLKNVISTMLYFRENDVNLLFSYFKAAIPGLNCQNTTN